MFAHVRSLAWAAAAVWLFGCGPSSDVDVSNTLESVLPATESSKDFGDYVVFFNAIRTDQLTPEVARDYGIVRSKSRALLNVSIHRKGEGGRTTAVTGAVAASAINLTGQLKTMTLREIPEGEAIYYIGELAVTDGEVLIYTVDVTPSNESSRFTVRFKKQFFVEQ
ncbi:MAG TPA: DUF4426 domain-containing protein [Gammaproteobacteria bacterium]|nr:DUF4426 domain-containing protein [Gammaproteobacteria bacterium]